MAPLTVIVKTVVVVTVSVMKVVNDCSDRESVAEVVVYGSDGCL